MCLASCTYKGAHLCVSRTHCTDVMLRAFWAMLFYSASRVFALAMLRKVRELPASKPTELIEECFFMCDAHFLHTSHFHTSWSVHEENYVCTRRIASGPCICGVLCTSSGYRVAIRKNIRPVAPVRALWGALQQLGPSLPLHEGLASEIDVVLLQIAAFLPAGTASQGALHQPQSSLPAQGFI